MNIRDRMIEYPQSPRERDNVEKLRDLGEKINPNPQRPVTMTSIDFLNACKRIQEERAGEYETEGGERSFEKISTAFNAITGKDLTPAEVALIFQILKDVRFFSQDRYHHDSVVDCISYASLKAELLYNQYHK